MREREREREREKERERQLLLNAAGVVPMARQPGGYRPPEIGEHKVMMKVSIMLTLWRPVVF